MFFYKSACPVHSTHATEPHCMSIWVRCPADGLGVYNPSLPISSNILLCQFTATDSIASSHLCRSTAFPQITLPKYLL